MQTIHEGASYKGAGNSEDGSPQRPKRYAWRTSSIRASLLTRSACTRRPGRAYSGCETTAAPASIFLSYRAWGFERLQRASDWPDGYPLSVSTWAGRHRQPAHSRFAPATGHTATRESGPGKHHRPGGVTHLHHSTCQSDGPGSSQSYNGTNSGGKAAENNPARRPGFTTITHRGKK